MRVVEWISWFYGLSVIFGYMPRWAITSLAGRQPGLDRIGADRLCGVRGPMRLRRNHDTRGDVVIVWIIVVRLGEACGHAGDLWRVYTGATM